MRAPFDLAHTPFDLQLAPFDLKHTPFDLRHTPFDLKHHVRGPFAVQTKCALCSEMKKYKTSQFACSRTTGARAI